MTALSPPPAVALALMAIWSVKPTLGMRIVPGIHINMSKDALVASDSTVEPSLANRDEYLKPTEWNHLVDDVKTKRLGQGSFGTIFLVDAACEPGKTVAIKQVVGTDYVQMSKEIIIQHSLDHQNIAQVFDYQPHSQRDFDWYMENIPERAGLFSIMMEPIGGGELFDIMLCKTAARNKLRKDTCTGDELPFADIPTRKKFIAEIGLKLLRGVEFMHQSGIAHRDLKGENVMVEGTNCVRRPEDCQLKIIDFGLACYASKGDTACEIKSGTPYFIPPEVYKSRTNPYAHDMFSVGMMLFQMWHAQSDFINGTAWTKRSGSVHKAEHPYFASFPFDATTAKSNYTSTVQLDEWVTSWDPNMPRHLKKVVQGLLRADAAQNISLPYNQPRLTVQQAIEQLTKFYEEDAFATVERITVAVQHFHEAWTPDGFVRQPYTVHEERKKYYAGKRNDASVFPSAQPPTCVKQCIVKQCSNFCNPAVDLSKEPYCGCPSPYILGEDGDECYNESIAPRALCHCSTDDDLPSCSARFASCGMTGVNDYCNERVMVPNKLPACQGAWVDRNELQAAKRMSLVTQGGLQRLADWEHDVKPICGRWDKGRVCEGTRLGGEIFYGTCQAVLMRRDASRRWDYVRCPDGNPPAGLEHREEMTCDKAWKSFVEFYECLPAAEGTSCTSGEYFYGYFAKLDVKRSDTSQVFRYDRHAACHLPGEVPDPQTVNGCGCGSDVELDLFTGEVVATPMTCVSKDGRNLDSLGPGFQGVCTTSATRR